jgi:hypothetical protein
LPGVRPAYSELFVLNDGTVRAAGVYESSRNTLEVVTVGGPAARVRVEVPGETIDAFAVAGDGSIVVASHTNAPNPMESRPSINAIFRSYRPDGRQYGATSLDGSDSRTVDERVTGLTILSDGDILVQTHNVYTNPAYGEFTNLFRLNPDGIRESAFGRAGVLRDPVGSAVDFSAFAATPDGGFVAVSGRRDPGTGAADTAVGRFLADGRRDAAFGVGGTAVADLGGASEAAYGIAADGAGGYVVSAKDGANHALLGWFASTGALVRRADLPADLLGESVRLAATAGGGLVYTATASAPATGGTTAQVVGRLTAAGRADAGFAPGGRVALDAPAQASYGGGRRAADVLVRPDGSILALGRTDPRETYAAVVRENPAPGGQPVRIVESSAYDWYVGPDVPVEVVVAPYLKGRRSAAP